ncbi:uncharacterized protein LOC62_03G004487 [Vanrija pseudolonga]|uniref:Uncharacterized protein n=1 Tax=Vanrija pseudolonga TaxID=143232 RepID=A0AAF0Y7S5_9TREE|nr:hypothetical protein LOC62_03G004487 [Vanrija pseudolonga]
MSDDGLKKADTSDKVDSGPSQADTPDEDLVPPYTSAAGPSELRRDDGPPAARHQPGPALPEIPPPPLISQDVEHGASAPPTAEPPVTDAERATVAEVVTKYSYSSQETQSWDGKLSDPVLLRNFICSHAADRPEGGFGIVGSHTETRWHTRQVKVGESWREERYSETVTIQDFSLTIDASPPRGNRANLHVWALPAGEPALRGTHHWSYGGPGEDKFSRVAASSAEGKAWAERVEELRELGNAPWLLDGRVHKFAADELGNTEAKSRPLEQWCEAFCADKAKYKRFVLTKEVWGWDFKATKRRIINIIRSSGYGGDLNVWYDFTPKNLIVRPNSRLVRAMHESWRYLMYLTCVWCCVKGWQRLDKNGGAPYEVVVASYGMKTYPPLPGTYPAETLATALERFPAVAAAHPEIPGDAGGYLVYGPKGVHYQLGESEDEFIARTDYTNKFTNCLQCDLDRTYPLDTTQDGSSYEFADAESKLVDLHSACVDYGSVPTATLALTEPPLPYPTPANMTGRPRSCEWLCYEANSTQVFQKANQIPACYASGLKPDAVPCEKYPQFCSVEGFNKLAACAQCRLVSSNTVDSSYAPGAVTKARVTLDEIYSLCHDMGYSATNVPLYTQFPLPTDTNLALTAAPTTTETRPSTTQESILPSTTKAAAAARATNPVYAAPVAAAVVGMYIMGLGFKMR